MRILFPPSGCSPSCFPEEHLTPARGSPQSRFISVEAFCTLGSGGGSAQFRPETFFQSPLPVCGDGPLEALRHSDPHTPAAPKDGASEEATDSESDCWVLGCGGRGWLVALSSLVLSEPRLPPSTSVRWTFPGHSGSVDASQAQTPGKWELLHLLVTTVFPLF